MCVWERVRGEKRVSQLVLLRCCHIMSICAEQHGNTVAGKKPRFTVCACAYERSRGRSRRRPCSQSWLLRSICRLGQCLLYAFIHFIHSLSITLTHFSLFPTHHSILDLLILSLLFWKYFTIGSSKYIYIIYLYLIYIILYNCTKTL